MHRFTPMSAAVLLAAVSLPALAFGAGQVPDVKGDWVGKVTRSSRGRWGTLAHQRRHVCTDVKLTR